MKLNLLLTAALLLMTTAFSELAEARRGGRSSYTSRMNRQRSYQRSHTNSLVTTAIVGGVLLNSNHRKYHTTASGTIRSRELVPTP